MLDTVPAYIGTPVLRECVRTHHGPGVPFSKVGTVCVSSASTGLCGGRRATVVPTATRGPEGANSGANRRPNIFLDSPKVLTFDSEK